MFFGRQISTSVIKARKQVFSSLVKCSENKNVSHLCSNLNIEKRLYNNKINSSGCVSSISQSSKSLFHNGEVQYNDNDLSTSDKLQEVDVKALSKGDAEVEHKLKVLLLEIEVLRQEGHPVPDISFMKPEFFEELLNLKSRSKRQKFLHFLFKKSKIIENKKVILY